MSAYWSEYQEAPVCQPIPCPIFAPNVQLLRESASLVLPVALDIQVSAHTKKLKSDKAPFSGLTSIIVQVQ